MGTLGESSFLHETRLWRYSKGKIDNKSSNESRPRWALNRNSWNFLILAIQNKKKKSCLGLMTLSNHTLLKQTFLKYKNWLFSRPKKGETWSHLQTSPRVWTSAFFLDSRSSQRNWFREHCSVKFIGFLNFKRANSMLLKYGIRALSTKGCWVILCSKGHIEWVWSDTRSWSCVRRICYHGLKLVLA